MYHAGSAPLALLEPTESLASRASGYAQGTFTEDEVARIAIERTLRHDRLAAMLSAWNDRMNLRSQLFDIDALEAWEQISCRPLSSSESTASCNGGTEWSGRKGSVSSTSFPNYEAETDYTSHHASRLASNARQETIRKTSLTTLSPSELIVSSRAEASPRRTSRDALHTEASTPQRTSISDFARHHDKMAQHKEAFKPKRISELDHARHHERTSEVDHARHHASRIVEESEHQGSEAAMHKETFEHESAREVDHARYHERTGEVDKARHHASRMAEASQYQRAEVAQHKEAFKPQRTSDGDHASDYDAGSASDPQDEALLDSSLGPSSPTFGDSPRTMLGGPTSCGEPPYQPYQASEVARHSNTSNLQPTASKDNAEVAALLADVRKCCTALQDSSDEEADLDRGACLATTSRQSQSLVSTAHVTPAAGKGRGARGASPSNNVDEVVGLVPSAAARSPSLPSAREQQADRPANMHTPHTIDGLAQRYGRQFSLSDPGYACGESTTLPTEPSNDGLIRKAGAASPRVAQAPAGLLQQQGDGHSSPELPPSPHFGSPVARRERLGRAQSALVTSGSASPPPRPCAGKPAPSQACARWRGRQQARDSLRQVYHSNELWQESLRHADPSERLYKAQEGASARPSDALREELTPEQAEANSRQFKSFLVRHSGNYARAWRYCLKACGLVTMAQFAARCRQVGFDGPLQTTWQSLNPRRKDLLSLRDLDEETASILWSAYQALASHCDSETLSSDTMLRALDPSSKGVVSYQGFCQMAVSLKLASAAKAPQLFEMLCNTELPTSEIGALVTKESLAWLLEAAPYLAPHGSPLARGSTIDPAERERSRQELCKREAQVFQRMKVDATRRRWKAQQRAQSLSRSPSPQLCEWEDAPDVYKYLFADAERRSEQQKTLSTNSQLQPWSPPKGHLDERVLARLTRSPRRSAPSPAKVKSASPKRSVDVQRLTELCEEHAKKIKVMHEKQREQVEKSLAEYWVEQRQPSPEACHRREQHQREWDHRLRELRASSPRQHRPLSRDHTVVVTDASTR